MKYYYLISGLPDIDLEDAKLSLTIRYFKADLQTVLSEKDELLLNLVFYQYDNQNLLSLLEDSSMSELKSDLGVFSVEELKGFISQVKEDEWFKDKKMPTYFTPFISSYLLEQPLQEGLSWENQISSLYYDAALKNKNQFLSEWFEFNLNINNLIAAYHCRKYGFDIQKSIIGNNEIAEIIRTTNSRDFGLTGVFDYVEPILLLLEDDNLHEREKKIDRLRWRYLDEHTFFHYFTIEKILSHVLKLQMISRWQMLDMNLGTQVFREMVESIKESVELK
jgi:hypothetical protein